MMSLEESINELCACLEANTAALKAAGTTTKPAKTGKGGKESTGKSEVKVTADDVKALAKDKIGNAPDAKAAHKVVAALVEKVAKSKMKNAKLKIAEFSDKALAFLYDKLKDLELEPAEEPTEEGSFDL